MVPLRFLRRVAATVLAAAAVACGGDDLVLPSDGEPAEIEAFQGDEQIGSAGLPLPDSIVAVVRDRGERPVPGVRVVFLLPEGADGDVSPDTVLTDNQGLAGANWTLGGTAGAQTVDASVVGEDLTVQFNASAGATDARAIEAFDGDQQTASVGTALADSLVVLVTDDFGNPAPGIEVAWSASTGEVNPATSVSDADGLAATRRILGPVTGEQTAEARVPGLDGSPVIFTHTAIPGTAASLVLISGNDQTGRPGEQLRDPLVVRLVDEAGNGIPDRAVAWVVATGDGSAAPETSVTDADGFAETEWTLGPSNGPNTLNAVVSGVGEPVLFTANGGGGGGGGGETGPSASNSSVTADPTSIQAVTGTATITVTVRDGSGAPVPGATVSLSATGSGNSITQPTAATGSDGVATGALQSTVPGTKVVSATVNGTVRINQTAQVNVAVAPATNVAPVAGSGQTAPAGQAVPIRPAVRVTNGLGLPVAGFPVSFVVTGGGGSVSGASQVTNSDGVATVGSWTLGDTPGQNLLEARAGSLAGSPVVFEATGSGGIPHHFVFLVQPTDVEEDEEFSPPIQVAIVDAGDNIVPLSGVRIDIDLLETDGDQSNDLDGDDSEATVNGVAVFPDLSVDDSNEQYRLRASSNELQELPPAVSQFFDVED